MEENITMKKNVAMGLALISPLWVFTLLLLICQKGLTAHDRRSLLSVLIVVAFNIIPIIGQVACLVFTVFGIIGAVKCFSGDYSYEIPLAFTIASSFIKDDEKSE